ncbi:uncharacterized protein LOC130736290 [Lotus japonicus]|uniref:uncharacterized protein LOC130736290 n=1 Tax=Lotus japonicus TaxID=34305 RepID=UPI002582CE14|nr:uncharacterized protein LOC130736290 [Lotus japonicus]
MGGSTGVEEEDDDGDVCEKNILDLTEDNIMGMEFDYEEDAIKIYERYAKRGVRHRKYLERRDRVRVAKGSITRVSCQVVYFDKTHSHVLAPVDKVHLISSYRHLNDSEKAHINNIKLHGVRTCNIMGLMLGQKGGHEALGFTKKDLFNHIDK